MYFLFLLITVTCNYNHNFDDLNYDCKRKIRLRRIRAKIRSVRLCLVVAIYFMGLMPLTGTHNFRYFSNHVEDHLEKNRRNPHRCKQRTHVNRVTPIRDTIPTEVQKIFTNYTELLYFLLLESLY